MMRPLRRAWEKNWPELRSALRGDPPHTPEHHYPSQWPGPCTIGGGGLQVPLHRGIPLTLEQDLAAARDVVAHIVRIRGVVLRGPPGEGRVSLADLVRCRFSGQFERGPRPPHRRRLASASRPEKSRT